MGFQIQIGNSIALAALYSDWSKIPIKIPQEFLVGEQMVSEFLGNCIPTIVSSEFPRIREWLQIFEYFQMSTPGSHV